MVISQSEWVNGCFRLAKKSSLKRWNVICSIRRSWFGVIWGWWRHLKQGTACTPNGKNILGIFSFGKLPKEDLTIHSCFCLKKIYNEIFQGKLLVRNLLIHILCFPALLMHLGWGCDTFKLELSSDILEFASLFTIFLSSWMTALKKTVSPSANRFSPPLLFFFNSPKEKLTLTVS